MRKKLSISWALFVPNIRSCLNLVREGRQTPESSKEHELVTVEDLALSNAYQLEAMINVLERKGLSTKAEVLEELKGMSGNG